MCASYVNGCMVLFTVSTYTEKLIFFLNYFIFTKMKNAYSLVYKIYFTHDQAVRPIKINYAYSYHFLNYKLPF